MQKRWFKTVRNSVLPVLAAVSLSVFLSGCSKAPKESWAYNYEPQKAVFNLYEDGTAELEGEKYTSYSKTDEFYELTGSDGSVRKLRYVMDGDVMNLYLKTSYKYQGDGEHEGILGYWAEEKDGRLTFEFTDKGTFLEDRIMPGHYTILDEDTGYVKLMYNDHYYDTYIYCEVNGDTLTVDYPWPMVQTDENAETNPKGTAGGK